MFRVICWLISQVKQWAFTSAVESVINCSTTCNFDCAATDAVGVPDSLKEFGISYTKNNITVNQNYKEFFPLNILNSFHIQYDHDVKKHVHLR